MAQKFQRTYDCRDPLWDIEKRFPFMMDTTDEMNKRPRCKQIGGIKGVVSRIY